MKKIFSMVLSLVLGFSFITVSASAGPVSDASPSQAASYSVKGRDAVPALKEMIEEEGIQVTDDTVIQLVPLSSSSKKTFSMQKQPTLGSALVITNQEGTRVTKDALVPISDDRVGFSDISQFSDRDGHSFPFDVDGKIVVRGTAVYDEIEDNFYLYTRPIGAYFSYLKYETCNVAAITVKYICSGSDYTYPGFQSVSDTPVDYVIRVAAANPVISREYAKTQRYRSDRVIYTGAGGTGPGNYLTFVVVLDGDSVEYTASL